MWCVAYQHVQLAPRTGGSLHRHAALVAPARANHVQLIEGTLCLQAAGVAHLALHVNGRSYHLCSSPRRCALVRAQQDCCVHISSTSLPQVPFVSVCCAQSMLEHVDGQKPLCSQQAAALHSKRMPWRLRRRVRATHGTATSAAASTARGAFGVGSTNHLPKMVWPCILPISGLSSLRCSSVEWADVAVQQHGILARQRAVHSTSVFGVHHRCASCLMHHKHAKYDLYC